MGERWHLTTYRDRMTEHELRAEIVRVSRLLWEKGLVAATDGNVSARLGSDRIIITPSGFSKGFIKPEHLIVTDMDGKLIPSYERGRRDLRPSSEMPLHLEAYRQRPDVQAVVHAHPPITVAFTIAGISLAQCVLPEVVVSLGSIQTTAYATPGTPEGAGVVRDLIRTHDALVLDHHGAVTVGKTVFDAYMKMEKVEHTAEITMAARQLGQVNLLPIEEVRKLVEKRRQALGLPATYESEFCALCGACGKGEDGSSDESSVADLDTDEIAHLVIQAVAREMGMK
jgi:L-fuculose-phosphate aldolase